jgi:hypothetical protein
MTLLALLLLLMIPVSMLYCAVYLIELIRMWKYTTTGAKIGQVTVSVVSELILIVVIYVLKTY